MGAVQNASHGLQVAPGDSVAVLCAQFHSTCGCSRTTVRLSTASDRLPAPASRRAAPWFRAPRAGRVMRAISKSQARALCTEQKRSPWRSALRNRPRIRSWLAQGAFSDDAPRYSTRIHGQSRKQPSSALRHLAPKCEAWLFKQNDERLPRTAWNAMNFTDLGIKVCDRKPWFLASKLVSFNLERRKDLVPFDAKSSFHLVRLAGIEPTTPWFVAKYSIQLSYSR